MQGELLGEEEGGEGGSGHLVSGTLLGSGGRANRGERRDWAKKTKAAGRV